MTFVLRTCRRLAAGCVLAIGLTVVWGPAAAAAAAGDDVYVANFGSRAVSEFGVGSGGDLTGLSPSSVSAGLQPYGVAVSPDGSSVYVTNAGDVTVSQYSVGSDGVLSAMSPSEVNAAADPNGIAVSPDGKDVYVANYGNGTVSQYSVGSGGALSPLVPATVPAGTDPLDVAVSPDGSSVYVTNFKDGTVSQYSRQADGTLAPMSPASVPAGNAPEGVAVSPDGHAVYVTNAGDNTVSQYSVGGGGALSPMTPATVVAGNEPRAVGVSPSGTSVYVTNGGSNTVSQYTAGPAGALSPMSPARVATGNDPAGVAVDADGSAAYVSNEADGTVSQYAVSSGGGLVAMSPATVGAGTEPIGIAVRALASRDDGTSASLSCSPQTVTVGQSASCTATVTDTAQGATTPTGAVAFSTDSSGAFAGSPCSLSGSGATASCQVSYTPSAVGSGVHTLTADYGGDRTHASATAGETVSVITQAQAAAFSDTTSGVHLGLAFDYNLTSSGASAVASNVDYIFGGYFDDWNFGEYPSGPHTDGYLPFDFDAYPQSAAGHSLADWQASHPDWIVYQCDGKTPAYYPGDSNIPLDFSNPAVRQYQMGELQTLFSQGANGVSFDNFTFANFTGACGVYKNGVWTPLGYPGTWQDNAKLDSDMMGWLSSMRTMLDQQYPDKTLTLNFTSYLSGLSHLQAVTPYIDMDFDEAGFTAYGDHNLADGAWQQAVDGFEYLTSHGKALDIDGITGAGSDAAVTHDQLNWALANYLLVKGAHTYTYLYSGGSSPDYGTFYDRPEYHIAIGSPTSARYQSQGIQMRNYSGGLALVNPSSTQTYVVSLGGVYQDMWGQTYATVTLGPTSAIVLLTAPGGSTGSAATSSIRLPTARPVGSAAARQRPAAGRRSAPPGLLLAQRRWDTGRQTAPRRALRLAPRPKP